MSKSKSKRHSNDGHVKQGELLDVHHPAEKQLLKLAARYRNLRDTRMQALTPELAARDTLLTAMHEAKLTTFERDGVSIEVVHGEDKVKVKTATSGNDNGD
jgi:hypothetical protein